MKKPRGAGAADAPVEVKRATMSLRNLPPAPQPVESPRWEQSTWQTREEEADAVVRSLMGDQLQDALYFILLDARGRPADDGRLAARVPRYALQFDFTTSGDSTVMTNREEIEFPRAYGACIVEYCSIRDNVGRELFRVPVGNYVLQSGTRAKFASGGIRITLE